MLNFNVLGFCHRLGVCSFGFSFSKNFLFVVQLLSIDFQNINIYIGYLK